MKLRHRGLEYTTQSNRGTKCWNLDSGSFYILTTMLCCHSLMTPMSISSAQSLLGDSPEYLSSGLICIFTWHLTLTWIYRLPPPANVCLLWCVKDVSLWKTPPSIQLLKPSQSSLLFSHPNTSNQSQVLRIQLYPTLPLLFTCLTCTDLRWVFLAKLSQSPLSGPVINLFSGCVIACFLFFLKN